MSKKIFEMIGFVSLVCFSFFYTSQISTVIKENDDLMKQIEDISAQYRQESIDAVIEGNTIIPGLQGKEVDVKKSYQKMKQINMLNTNLLEYQEIKPEVSSYRVYGKYIIRGNPNKKQAALIFLVNDHDDVHKITSILKDKKATFFIDGHWFENNNQTIIDLINAGHTIGNLGYDLNYQINGIAWMNTIVSKIGKQKTTYCYNEIEDIASLDICKTNKSYTIRPDIITTKTPLTTVKEGLKNGSMISLEINDITMKELPLIIDFIHSKDLELVNLEELLTE